MEIERKASFVEHLEELRKRLLSCIIIVGICFLLTYIFSKDIFKLLMLPLLDVLPESNQFLHFTGLIEPFYTYMKVAFFSGLFVASPYILYQIWAFVSPGLYSKEKKYLFPFVFLSTIFFTIGALFGYFVIFPVGFKVLLNLSGDFLKPMITASQYLSLASTLLFGFGIIFEIPLVVFLLSITGVIDEKVLISKWRYIIVFTFIVSAVLTPPDVASMFLMEAPMLLLYAISIGVAYVFKRKE